MIITTLGAFRYCAYPSRSFAGGKEFTRFDSVEFHTVEFHAVEFHSLEFHGFVSGFLDTAQFNWFGEYIN